MLVQLESLIRIFSRAPFAPRRDEVTSRFYYASRAIKALLTLCCAKRVDFFQRDHLSSS